MILLLLFSFRMRVIFWIMHYSRSRFNWCTQKKLHFSFIWRGLARSHRRIINDVRHSMLKFAFTGTYWRVRQSSLLFPHSRSKLSATMSQSISLTGSLKSLTMIYLLFSMCDDGTVRAAATSIGRVSLSPLILCYSTNKSSDWTLSISTHIREHWIYI